MPAPYRSMPAGYFVTAVVAGRRQCLSRITADGRVVLRPEGAAVERCWARRRGVSGVRPDALVVMPDHVHALCTVLPAGGPPPVETVVQVVTAWLDDCVAAVRAGGDPAFEWDVAVRVRTVSDEARLDDLRGYIRHDPLWWTIHPPADSICEA